VLPLFIALALIEAQASNDFPTRETATNLLVKNKNEWTLLAAVAASNHHKDIEVRYRCRSLLTRWNYHPTVLVYLQGGPLSGQWKTFPNPPPYGYWYDGDDGQSYGYAYFPASGAYRLTSVVTRAEKQ
jgi:hypothetical protein